MKRHLWRVYVLLAGVVIGVQIFWTPAVGLVNNGDFSKVAGYYSLGPWNGTQDEYKWFVSDFVFSPQYHWESRIFSSEHVFVWPVVRFSQALISRTHFDIRLLGLVHLLVLLLAFAGAGLVLSKLNPIRAAGLAIFTLLLFTDVAYASSLNSFYTDTATMIFALTTTVAMAGYASATDHRWLWITCLAVSGVLLITSKLQHAVLGLPLCLFGIVSGIQASKKIRAAWIAVTMVWAVTMAAMTQSSDPLYKTPPLFTTIFYKIGRSATDPAKDFQELGLGPEYVRFKGLFAYSEGSPVNDSGWAKVFLSKTGFGKISLFYLHHPQRGLRFIWQDLKDFGGLNPDPGLLDLRGRPSFLFGHAWQNYLFRKYPGWVVGLFIISIGLSVACCVSPALRARYPAWLCFVAVLLMALLSLAVATLADAADTARHLFIFHVFTDVLLCFWAGAALDFIASSQAVKLPPMQHADAMQRVSEQ